MASTSLTVSLGALALAVSALLRLKHRELSARRRIAALRAELTTSFAQCEALMGLYCQLQLSAPLPPTRGWAGSPDFLALLARHVERARPQTVVECGSGVSTVVLARALQRSGRGHVYSLEHLPEAARRTREWLAAQGLEAWASVLDAPLVETAAGGGHQPWYELKALPALPVDMLVVDGPPLETTTLARYPAGPALFPRLSAGAAVFLDDADRAQEQAAIERWRREFPEVVAGPAPRCEKGVAILTRGEPH